MKLKACVLALLALMIAAAGFCAEAPLTIGVNKNFPPFSFLNVESRPAGLFIDVWRLWAEKTGREIEFRPEQWTDLMECFKSGAVHIHGGLFKTEAREAWVEFSRPFYEIEIRLIYPVNGEEIAGIENLAGHRVGVHQGTYQEAWLRACCPDITVSPLRTTEDLIFAARHGKIKAFLADAQTAWAHLYQLGLSSAFKMVPAPLYSEAFHAGVLKNDAGLIAEINRGFGAMSNDELAGIETRWIHDPKYQYFARRTQKIQFSPEASRFIRSHPVVRAGLIPGFEPYMFLDADGAFQGVIPDYLKLIGERTGLEFDFVFLDLSELGDVMGKDLDMFPGLESPERAKRMLFTETVLTDPWVLVNRGEAPLITGLRNLKGRTVSLVDRLYIHGRLESDYPEIRLLTAKTHEEALKNVSVGQADAYIGPLAVAGRLIQHRRLTNLKIAAPAEYPGAEMKFGVRKDQPELVGILNKAISRVTRREFDAILRKWIPVLDDRRIEWKKAWRWMAGVLAVFGALLAVSLWWNRRLAVEMAERRHAQRALRRIEWLLTKSVVEPERRETPYEPPYGDVTALNACRVILDAVGKETLKQIAEDTIDLLDTSVAIYEINGNYAFGMFSSGWCRLLDLASRNLCNTDDNHEALTCGKWLCHENCWNDSAKAAILSGQITDIACIGGVRLYGVPIFAGGDVIGAVNIGYGDPPTDEKTLMELADRFSVTWEELREAAEQYQSRPRYIIELAKKRLQTAADLIGQIVERKRAEELLKESEKRFRSLFEYANDGICIIDPDGRFLAVNRRMCEMFGYDEAEFAKMSVNDIAHSEDVSVSPGFIKKYKSGEIEYATFEKRYLTKQGRTIYGQVAGSVIRNAGGEVQYYISHLRDMTDRKQAEERLQQYSEHLEDMVKARTSELEKAQAELLVKERLAVLGHFSGSISHELRNPLAAIDASAYYLNLVLTGQEDKVSEHLQRIRNNVKKSTDIIQSLLNLSRMEKPAAEARELRGLMEEALRGGHIPHTVETVRDFPETDVFIDADPEQIRMAMKNLIKNAVQAMEETGTLTVAIRPCGAGVPTCHEAQAGTPAPQPDTVEISISDTGPGISEKHIESVFEPLFTTKTHGIGFGLSITRMIIENHGGTIRAASGSASGATFTAALPMRRKGGAPHA